MLKRKFTALNVYIRKKGLKSIIQASALAGVTQLAGAASCKPEGHGFDSQSGHMPRLQVRSSVRAV